MDKSDSEKQFSNKPLIPERLYKFASFDIEKHYEELIRDNILYFSAPSDFNDPFDCSVVPNFSKFTYEHYVEFLKTVNRYEEYKYSPFSKAISAKKNSEMARLFHQRLAQNLRNSLIQIIGISCFCENKDNLLMWSHYAKGHKGVCLEFEGPILLRHIMDLVFRLKLIISIRPVRYGYSYPVFPFPIDLFEWYNIVATTKSEIWNYEREWRIIYMNGAKRKPKYPENALKSIYFGVGCTEKDIENIKILIKDKTYKPKLYKGRMADFKFEIVFEEIPNT